MSGNADESFISQPVLMEGSVCADVIQQGKTGKTHSLHFRSGWGLTELFRETALNRSVKNQKHLACMSAKTFGLLTECLCFLVWLDEVFGGV